MDATSYQAALVTFTNGNEGLVFANPSTTYTAAEYAQQMFPKMSAEQAASVEATYAYLLSKWAQASAIMGDSMFTCPGIWAFQSFANGKKPFKGLFNAIPGVHLQDLGYYFDGLLIVHSFPISSKRTNSRPPSLSLFSASLSPLTQIAR